MSTQSKVAALCVVTLILAFIALRSGHVTEAQKAADKVTAHFTNPRVQYFGGTGIERGPRDEKPDPWAKEDKTRLISKTDRREATELVAALCEGNLAKLQAWLDRYDDKPFALAKVCDLANYSLYLAGSQYSLLGHGSALYIEKREHSGTPDEKGLTLRIKEKARVLVWTKGEQDASFVGQPNETLDAGKTLLSIGIEIISHVNSGAYLPKDGDNN